MRNSVRMVARARRCGPTRRTLVSVVVLTFALLWPTIVSAQVSPLQTRVVVDRTYAAVVRVRVPLGLDQEGRSIVSYGSGTIVSPTGYVLTNYHVVGDRGEGAPSIQVWRQDAGFEPLYHAFDATFVRGDAQLDLAVLRIVSDANGQPVRGEFAFFPIGDFRALGVKLTDPIDAIGFPRAGGSSMTAVEGTVSGFMREFDFQELYRLSDEGLHSEVEAIVARIPAGDAWIKTSAPFTGGISGGALLDANGVLIGVPTLTLGALRLARPAILARPLLYDVPGVEYVVRASQPAPSPDSVADPTLPPTEPPTVPPGWREIRAGDSCFSVPGDWIDFTETHVLDGDEAVLAVWWAPDDSAGILLLLLTHTEFAVWLDDFLSDSEWRTVRQYGALLAGADAVWREIDIIGEGIVHLVQHDVADGSARLLTVLGGASHGASPEAESTVMTVLGSIAPCAEMLPLERQPPVSAGFELACDTQADAAPLREVGLGASTAVHCPPGCSSEHAVWGTDTYTDDSSVCRAAIHAGVIDAARGGSIIVTVGGSRTTFVGSTRHGVTTRNWVRWPRSFAIAPFEPMTAP